MPWTQIIFTVTPAQAEPLAALLDELGALAVMMQSAGGDNLFDQIDESPALWNQTRLTALFEHPIRLGPLLADLGRRLQPRPLPAHVVEEVADRDWNRAWMDRFRPLRFGRRLWVVPSWLTPPDPDAINLILDPGMAFGTGTHPTTAMCLTWMEGADLRGRTVIDYGCGSGILAIAAVRLGAARVHAVDIDPQCLEVTRDNAERNGVLARITISLPPACTAAGVDVLIANILAGPLAELAPRLTGLVRAGGYIVLSGLLAVQIDDCLAAYRGSFNMEPPRVEEDWAMLAGSRRGD